MSLIINHNMASVTEIAGAKHQQLLQNKLPNNLPNNDLTPLTQEQIMEKMSELLSEMKSEEQKTPNDILNERNLSIDDLLGNVDDDMPAEFAPLTKEDIDNMILDNMVTTQISVGVQGVPPWLMA